MLARAAGKPIRVASKSVRCREVLTLVDERDERFRGLLCFTVAEALMLAEAGRRDLVVAYPSVDRRAISRLAELAHADPEAAPVADGRRGGAARSDRGLRRRRADADPGRDRHRRRLPGPPRRPPGRAEAIADQDGRGSPPVRRGDRLTTGAGARRADGLRGPDRGGRRCRAGTRPPQLRDPPDAELVAGRDPRAPGRDRRRGHRGRAASVRQRRRHRQPRADERRAGGHRAGGRLGLLRPRVVRRLQPLLAAPGRRLRPADRPPLVPRLRDRARRRLRRLGPGGRRPAAAALAARRPPPRSPRGGR